MNFIHEAVIPYVVSLIDMEIVRENVLNGSDELIFIVEHEGVYSAGKSFEPKDFVGEKKYKIYYSNRGGRVTVHNRGQIVVYPIINLLKRKMNISEYIKTLENWIINVLKKFNLKAYKTEENIGIWVNNSKIGFLGIKIVNGVSTHGVCLNVNNNLEPFKSIIPCGIHNLSITSVERELGCKIEIESVAKEFINTCPF